MQKRSTFNKTVTVTVTFKFKKLESGRIRNVKNDKCS